MENGFVPPVLALKKFVPLKITLKKTENGFVKPIPHLELSWVATKKITFQ